MFLGGSSRKIILNTCLIQHIMLYDTVIFSDLFFSKNIIHRLFKIKHNFLTGIKFDEHSKDELPL